MSGEVAVIGATRDVDVIVHFGGAPLERPWVVILDSNIRSSYHIYEGTRRHGVKGRYFLSGCAPVEDPAVDWDDFDPRYDEFEEIVWPTLAERSEAFEAINQWAGHYDFNTLDHNLVVGRHPEVTSFIFAIGFSGHGLQQSPATGRAVSELITYRGYRTLDFV